jgi:hypothetical protein
MQEQASLPYRSLEYWTPPKKITRHIRGKSSAVFTPERTLGGVTITNQTGIMSRYGREGGGNGSSFNNMQMDSPIMKEPRAYVVEKPETLRPRWYDYKNWGWKTYAALSAAVAIAIIVIVVAVVEVEKANRYPNYSKLTYTLEDTCLSPSQFAT